MARIRTVKKQYFVYCLTEIGNEDAGPCKVGVTAGLGGRLSSLQGGNWRPLKFAWTAALGELDHALNIEQTILIKLRPSIYGKPGPRRALMSEWVDAGPHEAYEAGRQLMEAFLEEEAA